MFENFPNIWNNKNVRGLCVRSCYVNACICVVVSYLPTKTLNYTSYLHSVIHTPKTTVYSPFKKFE